MSTQNLLKNIQTFDIKHNDILLKKLKHSKQYIYNISICYKILISYIYKL